MKLRVTIKKIGDKVLIYAAASQKDSRNRLLRKYVALFNASGVFYDN